MLAVTAVWCLLIPLWREFHFYFAHRFLHIRCIYKYVHALHHRDSDPEPFSGICMHPVEHLLYYSCAFIPSLFVDNLSPLIFLWNFVHLVLAPAAGHSGFEDHLQADQYHAAHHAKFECNYGSPFSGFIDQYMGTFRESMGASTVYRGEWSEKQCALLGSEQQDVQQKEDTRPWSAQGYLAIQKGSHLVYTLGCLVITAVGFLGIVGAGVLPMSPYVPAVVVAYGPIALAWALCLATKDPMSWRWPFQRENIIGGFGFFALAAWLTCVLPIYYAVLWASAESAQ